MASNQKLGFNIKDVVSSVDEELKRILNNSDTIESIMKEICVLKEYITTLHHQEAFEEATEEMDELLSRLTVLVLIEQSKCKC